MMAVAELDALLMAQRFSCRSISAPMVRSQAEESADASPQRAVGETCEGETLLQSESGAVDGLPQASSDQHSLQNHLMQLIHSQPGRHLSPIDEHSDALCIDTPAYTSMLHGCGISCHHPQETSPQAQPCGVVTVPLASVAKHAAPVFRCSTAAVPTRTYESSSSGWQWNVSMLARSDLVKSCEPEAAHGGRLAMRLLSASPNGLGSTGADTVQADCCPAGAIKMASISVPNINMQQTPYLEFARPNHTETRAHPPTWPVAHVHADQHVAHSKHERVHGANNVLAML